MNEKQIECFLTVSKYQSFSRAAQALFMTQPTVTHQIAALEEELGFSLFVRSYRAISLTPAGQRFEERMRPAVEQLQSIISECKQIARNEDGCLTLGHYFPEGDWMFYHAIYAFSSLYPAFHIDTHLPPSTELVDRLLTRQLDAIVAPHQLITVQDELKQTTLFSNPEYCVMSRNHPLAERESLTLNDLQDTLCLLDNDDPFKIKTWHEIQIRAQRSQFSRNGRTMREIVTNLRSQPCVMLSLYPVLFIADDLVRVPFADGPQVQTDLVWRADNAKAALITRGNAELSRLGIAMGCKAETFAGLSGMGDLIVTCTSMHSRNLHAGMLIGRGKSVEEAKTEVGQVVEGINALPAACRLAKQYKVEMPIVQAVEAILDGKLEARSALMALMGRSLKRE